MRKNLNGKEIKTLYEKAMACKNVGNEDKASELKWEIALKYRDRIERNIINSGVENNEDTINEVLIGLFYQIEKYSSRNIYSPLYHYLDVNLPRIVDELRRTTKGDAFNDEVKNLSTINMQSLQEESFTDPIIEKDYINRSVYPFVANVLPEEFLTLTYLNGIFSRGIPCSLSDIGYVFGRTQERIRQIERSCKRKIDRFYSKNQNNPYAPLKFESEKNYKFFELLKSRDRFTNIPLTEHTLVLFDVNRRYLDDVLSNNFEDKLDDNNEDENSIGSRWANKKDMITNSRGETITSLDELVECVKNHEEILTRPRAEEDMEVLNEIFRLNRKAEEERFNREFGLDSDGDENNFEVEAQDGGMTE